MKSIAKVDELTANAFYAELDSATDKVSAKSGLLRILPGYAKQFIPKPIVLQLPKPLTMLYKSDNRKMTRSQLNETCNTVFDQLAVTSEQVEIFLNETIRFHYTRNWQSEHNLYKLFLFSLTK